VYRDRVSGHKRKRRRQGQEVTTPEQPTLARRHTFSAGLLGHDLTASSWLVNVSEQTILGSDTAMACVMKIADAIAGAPMGEWVGNERVPSSDLVRQPMSSLSQWEWKWRVAATLTLYRYVYLLDPFGGSPPVSLVPLAPSQVTNTGGKLYVDGRPLSDAARLYQWRRAAWPSLSPDVASAIVLARETFAAAMAAGAYQSDFWQQGGAPVTVLVSDQEIENTVADGIRDRWVEMRTSSPGKPAVLSKGAKPVAFGADLGTDGAGRSMDKINAAIARQFGVPPSLVNVAAETGSLTYQTTEQEGIHFARYTLQGYADCIGDSLSLLLPGPNEVRLRLDRVTQPELLARFQAYEIALDAEGHPGWLTRDEIRALEGLPLGEAVAQPAAQRAPSLAAIA
jgi:phage portal protein BeeE